MLKRLLRNLAMRLLGRRPCSEKEMSDILIARIRQGGGKVGENVDILSSSIDLGEPYLISIGNNTTLTGVRILTHDASTKKPLGYSKTGRVTIGDDCFVGWGSIILADTRIGDRVIVGAGAVVARDIPANSVAIGNPVRVVCTYDDYLRRMQENMERLPCIDLLPEEILLPRNQADRDLLISAGKGFIR